MKRTILICIGLFTVIIGFTTYYIFLHRIDTIYAINFSRVFGSYDIRKVDLFLDEETIISYRGTSKNYKQLRKNVMSSFKERRFKMLPGSSYGHGDNKFTSGVQQVYIQSYVKYNNRSLEVPIVVQLEMNGINRFRIKSLNSNVEFFGYLFFRENCLPK